jgi:hypothetical protein
MSRVRVLVGTRKGAFVLEADGQRKKWNVTTTPLERRLPCSSRRCPFVAMYDRDFSTSSVQVGVRNRRRSAGLSTRAVGVIGSSR